jgi:hypothetical protein
MAIRWNFLHLSLQRYSPDVLAVLKTTYPDLAVMLGSWLAYPYHTKTRAAASALNSNDRPSLQKESASLNSCPDWSNINCFGVNAKKLPGVVHTPYADWELHWDSFFTLLSHCLT